MTIEAMGTGLKTRLQTISALRSVYAPNGLPGTINAIPCALILQGDIDYMEDFGDALDVIFRVIILVGKEDQKERMNDIIDYTEPTGSRSVWTAIEDEGTLGGAADFSSVRSNSGVGFTEWGSETFISTEFQVQVHSS